MLPWHKEPQRLDYMAKTATGLVIGRSYVPRPPRDLGSEGEQIQAALLHKPAPLAERLLNAFNNNAMPILLSILGSGFMYGLVKRFT